jgi:hypothetical protein
VDADLDTLATALYVKTDDLLIAHPGWAPERPAVGIPPRLCDAEVVTLSVMQSLLGFTSEARWLRHARKHLRHLFPYLPKQPGYNKRLRASSQMIVQVIRALAMDTSMWTDQVWVVDSTPVECGRSKETARRSELAGWAEYGYCASCSRCFWGLLADRPNQTLMGDKNYFGRDFEGKLADAQVQLLRPARKGEPERAGAHLFKPLRQTIESSTRPSKASSTSNATAGTPRPASSCASCNASSPSPPRSGTTTTPANPSLTAYDC